MEANVSKMDPPKALSLELFCPICLQFFSEPVSLPCDHIYCLACLQTMGEGLDQHSCPECQAEYQGTTALVKSTKMCNIIETYKAAAGTVAANPFDDDDDTEESNTEHHRDMATAGERRAEYQGTKALVKSTEMCSILETNKGTAGRVTANPFDDDDTEESNTVIETYNATARRVSANPFDDDDTEESNTVLVTYKATARRVSSNPFDDDDTKESNTIIETYKATARRVAANPFDIDDTEESNMATAGESRPERSGSKGSTARSSPLDRVQGRGKGKMEMDEPKFRMASQVTELSLKLEMAEGVLKKEKEREVEVTTANGQLREKACRLLGQIQDLSQRYSAQVMQLIEEEIGPGEASIRGRVSQASELTKQLRQAMLRAESLLTEDDEAAFSDELRTLQPRIVELMAEPVGEEDDHIEWKVNPVRACPKLEDMNAELRERVGEIQRSLRSTLNSSEVTFDPETAHPNLVLSEDLKTVTFSAAKQPYPSSPRRFTNFFQVLSAQSFYEGEHCWEVELEGSPWIVGMCYDGKLARSGLPSALESSRSSWCLMWFNNLLTAFEQGHDVPLKKTTVSRRLEIRLSFKTHRLSFYNVSAISGKTHVYTFKANLTEPVHLAYRMMSGHPKGRVTIYS